MSANQIVISIAAMARVLGVSAAGYHAWRQRQPSVRTEIPVDERQRRVD